MPHPLWRHGPCCHQPGTFDCWHLTMHQEMARYQYIYGLKPLGPHRALADALFTPLRAPCSRCAGRGILTRVEGEWHACPTCEGTGGAWTVAEAEVQAAHRKVVDTFPRAATARAPIACAPSVTCSSEPTPSHQRHRSGRLEAEACVSG